MCSFFGAFSVTPPMRGPGASISENILNGSTTEGNQAVSDRRNPNHSQSTPSVPTFHYGQVFRGQ
jgi:hypothetical protein